MPLAVSLNAQGLGAAIVWTPTSITDTANPGSRQDIPVTFTSSANVSNVVLAVVPALQSSVTVTPSSFAALQKGQVATVTLTISPPANAALGIMEGTVHIRVGQSTIARPLPVNVVIVMPEVINGITVPPEPPAALNNATLAGFDANGNGIRDDVERLLANTFGANLTKYNDVFSFAVAEQALIVTQGTSARDFYTNLSSCVLERGLVSADELDKGTTKLLNTRSRSNAYATTLAGAIGRGCK